MKVWIFLAISIVISFLSSTWATGQEQLSSGIKEHTRQDQQIQETSLQRIIPDQDFRLTFMSILSTLFAVFFVYSSFKIDDDLRNLRKEGKEMMYDLKKRYEENLKGLDEKSEEEKSELKQELSYIGHINHINMLILVNKYEDAVEYASNIIKDEFVKESKHSDLFNQFNYLISKSYYERRLSYNEEDKKLQIELLSKAIIYADVAIENANDPYKTNLIKYLDIYDLDK